MELDCEVRDDVLVVGIRQDVLDASVARDFKTSLMAAIEKSGVYQVVVDLSVLRFIDSSGLGVFLATLRYLKSQGGDLKLVGMSSTVQAMFQIVRMHKLFEIFATVDEALTPNKPA